MMQSMTLSILRRLKLRYVLVTIFFAATVAGCSATLPRVPGKKAATYKATVDVLYDGFKRNYFVHLPPGYDGGRPLPMVIVLHGAAGNSKSVEHLSGFSNLADEEHFIVLYPNGIGFMGNLQTWNAGHCCGKAAKDNIDDLGYLVAVIEDACMRLAVDRNRIYMVGFSNGAMMTYCFAAERGDLLTAIAPLAGSAGGRPDPHSPEWIIPEPVKALPIVAIHGLADDYVPFNGGTSPARKTEREYISVMNSLEIWAERNGCENAPVEHDERKGKVHKIKWQHCLNNDDVVLYTLQGWPHEWPVPKFTDKLDPQDPLYNFDAAHIIWDFFDSTGPH